MTSEKEKMLIIKDVVEQLYHRYDAHFITYPCTDGVLIHLEFAKDSSVFVCVADGETFGQALDALAKAVASRTIRDAKKITNSSTCLANLIASNNAADAKGVKP